MKAPGVAFTNPVIGTVGGIANLPGDSLRKKYALTAWGQTAADTGVATRFRMARTRLREPLRRRARD